MGKLCGTVRWLEVPKIKKKKREPHAVPQPKLISKHGQKPLPPRKAPHQARQCRSPAWVRYSWAKAPLQAHSEIFRPSYLEDGKMHLTQNSQKWKFCTYIQMESMHASTGVNSLASLATFKRVHAQNFYFWLERLGWIFSILQGTGQKINYVQACHV